MEEHEGAAAAAAASATAWRKSPEDETRRHKKKFRNIRRHRFPADRKRISMEKKDMEKKALVLNEMMSNFAAVAAAKKARCSQPIDDSQEHIKDRFNFVKKKVPPSDVLFKQGLQRAGLLIRKEDNEILDLVTQIKSPKFKIAEDPNKDFNISRGVATISCYDNIPRVPAVEMGDGNSLESRPDLTQKLDSIEIHCDSFVEMCANVQNQTCSQTTFDPNLLNFSSRFREYCTNRITHQLNESLEKFIAELSRLQKNLYNRDNAKGRFRRRFYTGFKEIERRLQLKKIKLVIMAPDLDKNKDNGELDNLTYRFIDSCKRHETPVIFGLSRRKLGYLTHGKGFVSCIGIANYEALEDKLEEALKKILEAKNEFKTLRGEAEKTIDPKSILTNDLLLSERVKVLLKTLTFL